ncbi:esterase-like activity of phytase family protein [Plastoroseomonas arctica]|uniref:Esterase-like activity of phytase family protein n=1 Tax=Plastoroseomonas arctica TaxID=1509237 RepID=A0AAF1JY78_9PROT|nr:esterase-like activity of phytase family protein [Plastoroseomonas arctica]MBR0653994.1 esterase-like activity of phytase family protein [Plastoroseomonas arctica]
MRTLLLAATAAIALTAGAQADQRFEATLAGHAILPAATFVPPPAGAPPGFALSGRFTGPGNLRNDRVGSLPGDTGPTYGRRITGLSLPFQGQPVQGFSGIKPVGDGSYWVLTDNGFGARRNSPDAMLMFHRVRPNFATGQVAVERTIFLSDPNRVIAFPIATDATEARFLTGADFDPESIQPMPDGSFWIGEEFGPFLVHVDAEGRVLRVVETMLDGQPIRSPDHPALQVPATPTAPVAFRARRSGGYEGMAASPDGRTLYALLEQTLFAPNSDQPEGAFLRILEFSTERAAWTGRTMRYRLEAGATNIGDFNMIDDRRALVIERDNGEGDPGLACAQGVESTAAAPCTPLPARFKRIYLIDLGDLDAEGYVRKIGHIDLMAIQDPQNLARQRGDRPAGAANTVLTFPFFTIENVAMVDADHIIVGNDNNLPFSAGRHLLRADDNELILLRVSEFLRAR